MLCMTIFIASRVPGVGNPRERVATSVSEVLHASGVDARGPVHLLGNAVEEKMIQRLAVWGQTAGGVLPVVGSRAAVQVRLDAFSFRRSIGHVFPFLPS